MAKESEHKILDLGCGLRKRPGTIGIDVNPRSQADVIHDLDVLPYPFPDNTFDEIICDNVIEHLDDVLKVMEEIYRISKPDGKVTIMVPFYPHRNANTDPTHKHFFGVHSFDYLIEGTNNSEFKYSPVHYELLSVEFEKGITSRHWFDDLIIRFANRNKDLYENRFANILPLRELTFELKVRK